MCCCCLYVVYILYRTNHTKVTHTLLLNLPCIWNASGVVNVCLILLFLCSYAFAWSEKFVTDGRRLCLVIHGQ